MNYAFTKKYPAKVNQLLLEITVWNGEKKMDVMGLWDTGATNTCITQKIADDLGLISNGLVPMVSASEETEVDAYELEIELPGEMHIGEIPVMGSLIGGYGYDVLIGMDIISLGQMSFSNYGGRSTLSFRFPAKSAPDYRKENIIDGVVGPRHGKGKRKKK